MKKIASSVCILTLVLSFACLAAADPPGRPARRYEVTITGTVTQDHPASAFVLHEKTGPDSHVLGDKSGRVDAKWFDTLSAAAKSQVPITVTGILSLWRDGSQTLAVSGIDQ